MLSFIGFHLRNIVHKVSWFVEQFKLFGVDEVTEFILNLNNELDDIKTVKTVIGESTIKVDTGFFGGSEIALNK